MAACKPWPNLPASNPYCILALLAAFISAAVLHVECSSRVGLIDSAPPASASANLSSNLASTQADFLQWVRVVSAKSHPATSSAAVFFTNAASSSDSKNVITVAKSGKADFSSVQAAVNAVPANNKKRVVIQIAAGTYKEKVDIPKNKPYISFIGAGSDVTTITWQDTATSAGSTFKSASVAVNSDFFIAKGISFKNSAPAPPPGAVGKQAVALRISGDKASFYLCKFYGAQDTLYDHEGRHYFKSCFIQGSIDFVFGNGLSYYDGCELRSIATSSGSLTAQKREKPSENTGFSFVNCKVTGSGMIYLGRAWGSYSRVVFLFSYIDKIIVPAGWNDFGDSSSQKTAFYGEYQCSGPGASSKNRVAWSYQLTAIQAAPFQSLNFVDGESWVQAA
ncbi:hypothetical protein GOP47_0004076 [Adiantum capillus-veneris]|uniref:Pectinesterase n=1 Tax=Adiantum capillus-veneris TaxID=13818 RepID=A0A9D4V769_ADICA|nr:hypothetical protein GOP47_0004076 [Adiantum capillus-veneris]